MRRLIVSSTLLGGALLVSLNCGHRPPRQGAIPVDAPDSLAGVVVIVGTAFEQRVALRTGGTVTVLSASAADSAALSRSGGVEAVVRGRSEGVGFRVASFVVRRVDGAPVVDGVIGREGDRLVLQTAEGPLALGNPPAAFRGMIGARVWVGGPLATGPNRYGLISPAP